jgi:hypothetical protein
MAVSHRPGLGPIPRVAAAIRVRRAGNVNVRTLPHRAGHCRVLRKRSVWSFELRARLAASRRRPRRLQLKATPMRACVVR